MDPEARVWWNRGGDNDGEPCLTKYDFDIAFPMAAAPRTSKRTICQNTHPADVLYICLILGYAATSVNGYCNGEYGIPITDASGNLVTLSGASDYRATKDDISSNSDTLHGAWATSAARMANPNTQNPTDAFLSAEEFWPLAEGTSGGRAGLSGTASRLAAFAVNSDDPYSTFKSQIDAVNNPTCVWPGGLGADGKLLQGCSSATTVATPIYKCGVTRDSPLKMTETSDTGEALMLSSRLFLIGAIVGLLASLAMALGHVGYGISAVPADFPTNTHACQLNPC